MTWKEAGHDLADYALLISLIVLVAIAGARLLGAGISTWLSAIVGAP